jgi:predicted methyltransferase
MPRKKSLSLMLGSAAGLWFLAANAAQAADAIPAYVKAAVADPGRPVEDIAHDSARKPAELMAFGQLKPGMVIAEFFPRGGYYTRMLSTIAGPKGKVYSVSPMRTGYPNPQAMNAEREELIRQHKPAPPDPYGATVAVQNIAEYSNVVPMLEMLSQYNGQFSVPEQVDEVWSADGQHDIHGKLFGVRTMIPAVNAAVFAALKPGGIYLVSDFSAVPGSGVVSVDGVNRTDPVAVKAELLAAGFVLDGESAMLANPNDDHVKAPGDPSFADGADRYTMRFKKPTNAANTDKRPPKNALEGYYGNTNIMNLGIEDKPPRQERRMFYHADGTYQEFGIHDMQAGLWYWDAAGHNCMLHQYPVEQRGFVVCHTTALYKKVGDNWTQEPAGGGPGAPTPFTMLKGYEPVIK